MLFRAILELFQNLGPDISIWVGLGPDPTRPNPDFSGSGLTHAHPYRQKSSTRFGRFIAWFFLPDDHAGFFYVPAVIRFFWDFDHFDRSCLYVTSFSQVPSVCSGICLPTFSERVRQGTEILYFSTLFIPLFVPITE